MKFHFSIRTALKESWHIFATHLLFFIVLSVVMLVLNVVSHEGENVFVSILIGIAIIIWSYVWLSAALAAVDGKNDLLQLSAIHQHFPSFRQFWKIIAIGILSAVISLVGFILLIIPGIYFMTRLAFANLSYVDRQAGVRQSLRYSWYLVRKEVFWTVLLTLIVCLVISVAGIALLWVGFLVAYPISMLLITKLYRTLTLNHPPQEVVLQPLEVLPSTEEPADPVVSKE